MGMDIVDRMVDQMEHTNETTEFSPKDFALPLKIGVDLGTSNIVITVLDNNNTPIAYALESAHVVKDGIVVDFLAASKIVSRLKKQLETRLGVELIEAATAIPPGIIYGNIKVIVNVVNAAGFNVIKVIDEPEAAAIAMQIKDGAVVDIGGGTTGVSMIRNGKVEYSIDEPTGGTHMTLVVAGNINTDFSEAERFKVEHKNHSQVFAMIHPVIEKMAHITKTNLRGNVERLYLAGGASCLEGIEEVFSKYTGIQTCKPKNPLLITPIGIAASIPSVRN